jgi:DNA-directed RNA polymerase
MNNLEREIELLEKSIDTTDTIDIKIQRQLQLEEQSVKAGEIKYYKSLDKLKKSGVETNSKPTQQFIKRNINLVAKAIDIRIEESLKKVRGKRVTQKALRRVKLTENVSSYTLAYHSLRVCLNRVSTFNITLANFAIKISQAIISEINFNKFKVEDEKTYRITQEHIKKTSAPARKQDIMRNMFVKTGVEKTSWTKAEQLEIGCFLIDIIIDVTKIFEVGMIRRGVKTVTVLNTTKDFLNWLEEAHTLNSCFFPNKLPMIIPPIRWTSPKGGGYLSLFEGSQSLINVKRSNKAILHDLDSLDLSNVYDAINAIQETPWVINKKILKVAQECWKKGIPIGKPGKEVLPTKELLTIPEYPEEWTGKSKEWRETDYEGYKKWSSLAASVHDQNNNNVSKRINISTRFTIANMLIDEEEIFFPEVLDFRGRVYPIPTSLTPQGDDLSKSLLKFAEGKPLGSTGLRWMYIHTANCFGIDKVSFDDRVKWTEDHLDALLEIAMNPMVNTLWMEADAPFSALAVCFELLEFSFNPETFKSYLPCPQDGSCNGLQNFSALLRDPIGANATNLIPSEEPQDIYSEVLELVIKRVHEEALEGNTNALLVDGFLSRPIVKTPVMTLPYGATKRGMAKQIEEALKKHNPGLLTNSDSWGVSYYLAEITYSCISKVVVAAVVAMDYLRECARVIASEDLPIRWTTPIGLPVTQCYVDSAEQRIKVHLNGVQTRVSIKTDEIKNVSKVNRRKQSAGIAPNFIHSLDSSHLMWTVLIALEQGLTNFSMIHDSYGVHFCDTDILNSCIRTAFFEMYSRDVLKEWTEEIKSQISPELQELLPTLPEMGNLDLSQVLDSKYFFA